ncbi:hypothetical protein QR77_04445 [Streptomyces sp. 150FB]|uniref:hypothetical protein n=1 Tax=Streptomyces sp. 150FB TaxID=1576605 RepID=UPI000588F5BA|nr:hypothetical protein [Streptomyces sp. 150FB]KIF73414.1 hypothetical protein QR77_04445 [Streptomyces sp. 150FB]
MLPSPERDHSSEESAEEKRQKDRELAEAEIKLARLKRMKDRLRFLQMAFTLIAAVTGNPVYRWAARGIQWVMELIRDSK